MRGTVPCCPEANRFVPLFSKIRILFLKIIFFSHFRPLFPWNNFIFSMFLKSLRRASFTDVVAVFVFANYAYSTHCESTFALRWKAIHNGAVRWRTFLRETVPLIATVGIFSHSLPDICLLSGPVCVFGDFLLLQLYVVIAMRLSFLSQFLELFLFLWCFSNVCAVKR